MSRASVDAVLAQARKALLLPDTTFRTEYDLQNTLAANLERLEAALALDPSRSEEIDALADEWRQRAQRWRDAQKKRGDTGLGVTAQDYLSALEQLEDEAADASAEDGGAAGKRKRKTKKERLAAKEADAAKEGTAEQTAASEGMGERGTSLEMHLANLHGEAPNPRRAGGGGPANHRAASRSKSTSPAATPRTAARRLAEADNETRGPVIATETLADPAVVASPWVLPPAVLESAGAIRLQANAATAEVVFEVMDTLTVGDVDAAIAAQTEAAAGGGRRRGGGRSPRRPATPTSTAAPPAVVASGAVPPGSSVDCRLNVLRVVLRALLHLGSASATAASVSSPSAAAAASPLAVSTNEAEGVRQVPVFHGDLIRSVLKSVTIGAESKLPKALRQLGAVGSSAKAGPDSEDDDLTPGMPPPSASAATSVFGTGSDQANHPTNGGDDEEDEAVTCEDLDALSAQLVAEFEAKEAEGEGEDDDALVGRTGLPSTVPAGVLAATLPNYRNAPMAVLMCHGGAFAGAIFVAGIAVVHKSFTRYVVRKKQGGKQSSAGTGFGSAGSQIRKMQETKWREDVKRILDDWRPFLDCCWVIAYIAPGPQNRKILTDFSVDWSPRVASAVPPPSPELAAFFEASQGVFKASNALKSPVDVADPRVLSAPLTTHKPTYAEVERIYAAVRSFAVERIYRGAVRK